MGRRWKREPPWDFPTTSRPNEVDWLRAEVEGKVLAARLRLAASTEADELGPVPFDPHERELWAAERRGAVEVLASFARDLLLEAAGVRGSAADPGVSSAFST
jgi:hypothetical protein